MKLVGATNWFVRGPVPLLEGLILRVLRLAPRRVLPGDPREGDRPAVDPSREALLGDRDVRALSLPADRADPARRWASRSGPLGSGVDAAPLPPRLAWPAGPSRRRRGLVAATVCHGALAADPPKRITGNFTLTATASGPPSPSGTVRRRRSRQHGRLRPGDADAHDRFPARSWSSRSASNGGCTPRSSAASRRSPSAARRRTFAFKALAPGRSPRPDRPPYSSSRRRPARNRSQEGDVRSPSSSARRLDVATRTPKRRGQAAKAVAIVTSRGPNDAPARSSLPPRRLKCGDQRSAGCRSLRAALLARLERARHASLSPGRPVRRPAAYSGAP